jgi:NAD/NADP transhydrogenase beta subunit
MEDWIAIGYLLSAALFIFGLKKLGHPKPLHLGTNLEPQVCSWLCLLPS